MDFEIMFAETYNEAKSKLSSFCNTSTTELEDTHKKRIPNKNFNSGSEYLSNVAPKRKKIATKLFKGM